jgi:hypothetical protein
MEIREAQAFLDPQFGYLAKSSGEQLSAHHFACWAVFSKLSNFIPSLDEEDKKLVEIACLIHDIAKMRPENQKILREKRGTQLIHKPTYEEVAEYLEKSFLSLSNEDKKRIFDIILTHHSVSEKDLKEITTPSAGILTELLRYSDQIASMDEVSSETIDRVRSDLSSLLDITYCEISRFPSPTLYLILNAIIEEYKNAGWQPLILLENGAVFVAKRVRLLEKDQVVDRCLTKFLDECLGAQAVYSPNFTKGFLGGLSTSFPASFITAKDHKEKIIDNLSDIERKGVQFLRLLFDLLSLDSISKIRKELPIWNLISACLGPSGHPKAKRLWPKVFSEDAPSSINREAISKLFSKLSVKDTIPSLHLERIEPEWHQKMLSDLKPDHLFEILYTIASYYEEEAQTEELRDYLDAIVSMEEEKDFEAKAQEIFERYKDYKATFDVKRAMCERCACPVPISAAPSLKLPQWGFSQIKAFPDRACASCSFCAYDSMVLKEKGDRVYLKVSSKIPEMISSYPEIDRLISRLDSGLFALHQIKRLKEREEFSNLPFPERIKVPLPRKERDERADAVFQSEQGVLFGLSRRDSGPKDIKARYEPLYHIMNLLGFSTEIGAEEQMGLFGERLISTPSAYYRSLAVSILAGILRRKGKKEGSYIFASEMFNKSPSVAIKSAADFFSGRKGCPAKRDRCNDYGGVCNCIPYNFFYFTLKGGDEKVKGILEDAAFLADKDKGIPHFCVEPERRGDFLRSLSKHTASKPISQSLDELMMGRGLDYALERFLRNLSKKIDREEQDELKAFVERVRGLLKRYEELHREDITGFIRAKNALCSAVYVFTKYQNLKEVVRDG